MVHAVFCLVSALTIMAAVAPLGCAGEVQKGNENIAANMTSNITLNQTTSPDQVQIIGSMRDSIIGNITLNAAGSITSNETRNAAEDVKVLRAGSESIKAPKALGWKSSRRTAGIKIGLEPKSELNLSRQQESVSKFKFNSDIYTPLFIQNNYMRTKPSYTAPDN
ncbi:MAG: hypothetical protein ACP5OM_02085, partial [Methanothrix sp.]